MFDKLIAKVLIFNWKTYEKKNSRLNAVGTELVYCMLCWLSCYIIIGKKHRVIGEFFIAEKLRV